MINRLMKIIAINCSSMDPTHYCSTTLFHASEVMKCFMYKHEGAEVVSCIPQSYFNHHRWNCHLH